jgi:hypothetical protein
VGLKPQFVRFFGKAVPREKGADVAWTDESSYCRADRALRLAGLGARKFFKDRPVHPCCSFRRLLSDGRVVTRVEIGITLPHRQTGRLLVISADELLQVADAMLKLPTLARTWPGRFVLNPLVLQGERLAKLFAYATSYRSKFNFTTTARLVEAGSPLLLIELEGNELTEWPSAFLQVKSDDIQGGDLAFGRIKTDWGYIPIWVLGPGQADRDQLRSLRLCLLRLHAEREALNGFLNQLNRQWITFTPGTPTGDAIECYLNKATRLINKREWSGINQSSISQAFDAAEEVQYIAERTQLLRRYEGARRQIWVKVQRYEEQLRAVRTITTVVVQEGGNYVENKQTIHGGTFYGAVVNKVDAERIENSFNTFNKENPGDDLKKAIAFLHEEVKALVAKLPEDFAQKEEVLANLETFTEQVSRKKPLGDVLKVTGKGLIDAAKTVAEMVGPITTAVTGVLKLFGLVLA